MRKYIKSYLKHNRIAQRKSMQIKRAHSPFKKIAFLFFIVICLLFLLKIKTHMVSGQSMIPTLQTKDRLFVVKGKSPNRYSLITFQPREKKQESYVKRVIGMPGDRIWLDRNTLYLNYQMNVSNPTPENNLKLSGEDLPDGTIKIRVTWEIAATLEELSAIPQGEYFVLGDNRRNSTDSRQLGLVHLKQIEGVVQFRYYPFNRLGTID